MAGLPMAAFVTRRIGRGHSPLRRLALLGRFLATGGRSVEDVLQTHCLSAGHLAERLGFGGKVRDSLLQAFERWDGKGTPGQVREEALAPTIRVVHLADVAEVYHRAGGVDAALEVAQSRRGTQFDPALVDRFCERAPQILDTLDDVDWNQVIESEPGLGRELTDAELDTALEAFGDFADLKSRFARGHSRGVADLTERAGARIGLAPDDRVLLRRAATVHDLGAIGIGTALWEKRGPLSVAEGERMRTHPYLAERTLARAPALAPIGALAALHHERLDGSGYPRGLSGDAIGPAARVLAAADVYHALTEERPLSPSPDYGRGRA
jgi:HD-GYP domain-containing protein (c-di-GMP phosphodiesterase class II)